MNRHISKHFLKAATVAFSVALAVLPACAIPVSPVVVYDSFGPGNTYLTTVGWGVEGAAAAAGFRGQAEWFVPGVDGNLNTIQLAMFRSRGSGLSNIYLAADNGGIPGTILESFLNVLSPGGLITLNSVAKSLLSAGSEYWICAEPADGSTVSGWYENNQSFTPGFAFERAPWSWSAFTDTAHSPPSGVLRVSVLPVPDVLGLPTAGLTLLGVCLLGRRPSKSGVAK
jgi:hypothetical protein